MLNEKLKFEKIKDVENSNLSKSYKEMRLKILNKMIDEIKSKIK